MKGGPPGTGLDTVNVMQILSAKRYIKVESWKYFYEKAKKPDIQILQPNPTVIRPVE